MAVLNGSTLYVLDRVDGKPVFIRRVGGAPGAAPALAKDYVFVPLVNGRMEAYPLNRQVFTPWYYQSSGRAMVAPLTTTESIVWSTDAGRMYVGNCNALCEVGNGTMPIGQAAMTRRAGPPQLMHQE